MTRASLALFALALSASSVLVVGAATAQPPPACPEFHDFPVSQRISPADRFARFDGGGVGWIHELRIDTDGSTVSYHPDNIGTTHLCNGMNPFVDGRCLGVRGADLDACFEAVGKGREVQWDKDRAPAFCVYGFEVDSDRAHGAKKLWGGGIGNGPIPVQGSTDPAPGFFFSQTAAPLPVAAGASRTTRYADADRVPYIVVPPSFVGSHGPSDQRAAAAVVRSTNLRAVPAIVADSGGSLGEVSVAAAQMVENENLAAPQPITVEKIRSKENLPFPYTVSKGRVRALLNPHDGPYLVFAMSSRRFGRVEAYSDAEVRRVTDAAFSGFGGLARLAECARDHFRSQE